MTKSPSRPKKPKTRKDRKSGRTAVVVLGMHRSGTSALAGTLNILGCDMAATPMDANDANERGYFESKRIYPLHSALLASAGSRWDDWLPINPGWFDSPRAEEFHDRAIETMQAEFGNSRLFVLKDPRISRLVPFWLDVFRQMEISPRFVLALRNPLEVAASLARRDRIDTELGLLIWLGHMLQAEAGTRGQPRCFTEFTQLMENWAGTAETVQSTLGVTLPRMSIGTASEVEAFLNTDLRHHANDPQKVLANPMISGWVRETYEILLRWVRTGEESADREALDTIRAAFEEAAPAFARLVQSGRDAAAAVVEAEDRFAELQGSTETLGNDLTALTTAHDTALQDIAELKTEKTRLNTVILDERARIGALQTEIGDKTETLETLRDQQAKATEEAEALRQQVDHLEAQLAQTQSALAQRGHEADEMRRASRDFERQLTEKTEAHDALARKLRETEEQMTAAILRKTEQVHTLETDVRTQHRELAELTRVLTRQETALEEERAAAARQLETEREARSDAESALNQLRQSQTDDRAAHARTLAQRDERIGDLDGRLRTNTREISEMSRMLAEAEHALKLERIQVEEMRQSSERAEFAVSEIRSSTSWRLMAPLRAVRSLIGRGN